MNALLQDLRHAIRQLRLNPGFALVAVLSLALGIGANTAIFQLLDAVRLRSLPIHDPKELAEVKIVGGNQGFGVTNTGYAHLTRPVWYELERSHEPFSGIFAWALQNQRVGQGSGARSVQAMEVSGEFFSVLGIQPWRGRMLIPSDEGGCTISRVVVSYPYWRSQMGGRELNTGTTLFIEGHSAEVVGVAPPGFFGMAVGESFDIAFPLCHPKELRREVFDLAVMGRLRPGWTLERASAQLNSISPGIFEATAPEGYFAQAVQQFKNYKLGAYSAGAGVSYLRDEYDSSLWLLLAITGLVLLIACANLANLMLARASSREREVAVRMALGASRFRLFGQSLAESGLLAVVGTALGIGLAQALSRLLIRAISTDGNAISLSTETNWRVLLFAASVAASTCIVFGIAPALRSLRAEPVTAMKSGGRGMTGSRERFSMQRLMVVVQISVSLVLLVGALLFVRSFRNLIMIDPGMRQSGISVAFVGFSDSNIPEQRFEEFKRELLDEVRSTPGVIDAALTTNVPLLGGSWTHEIQIGSSKGASKFAWVSPDYFRTMAIPVQSGRSFNQNDTSSSPRVAVVNQAFIKEFLGGKNPIGLTLRTSPEPQYPSTVYEIVGVIHDTKYACLSCGIPPQTFAPASQLPNQHPWTWMMIQGNNSPEIAIKKRLAERHPEIEFNSSDFQQDIRDRMVLQRLLAMLSGFFGLLAALLATVGLYGVISYTVARRRSEIGIRVALGAARRQVVGMVMREAGTLLVIGIAVGTGLALLAGRSASSMLFGLKSYDPLTLIVSVALLVVIAAVASFLPARQASKVDPMEALRYE